MKNTIIILVSVMFISSCCSQKRAHRSINFDSQELTGMSKVYNPQPMYELFRSGKLDILSCPYNNETAINVYEQRIAMLREELSRDTFNISMLNEIMFCMNNFELLTGIESEADASFIGRSAPTLNDVNRWEEWLKDNRLHLCWYEKEKLIFQRK